MKCDELKAYVAGIDGILHKNQRHGDVYLKSEVDAVIAELQKQVHDYAQGLYVIQARAEKEACHQKHKRCLAMARGCRLRARWFGDNAFYKKEQRALQWHKRWLELAEKFKEAK